LKFLLIIINKYMIEESKQLLEQKWKEEEKILIKRILDTVHVSRHFIPKNLKKDIAELIKLATNIKKDYENLQLNNNKSERRNSI